MDNSPLSPATTLHEIDDAFRGIVLDEKYEVVSRLGGGGMGVVYRGVHKLIDRPVAIKILRTSLVQDQENNQSFFARFHREAQASSKIEHPHAVDIYDFGVHEGFPYIVMQFIDGKPLKQLLAERGALSLADVSTILTQIGGALGEAHRQGVVHRDLKPDNIMIEERPSGLHSFIVDFGVAKVISGEQKGDVALTKVGTIVGTPHYMSPEQVKGEPVDARSDIYSLGIMLYQMLSGEAPFNSDSAISILMQHMTETPPPVNRSKPGLTLPRAAENAILKALEKKPERRQQSVQELVTEFNSYPVEAPASTGGTFTSGIRAPLQNLQNLGRKTNKWVVLSVVVIAALVAVIVFLLMRPPQLQPAPVPAATPAAKQKSGTAPALDPDEEINVWQEPVDK